MSLGTVAKVWTGSTPCVRGTRNHPSLNEYKIK
jgi:hypothetical protein